MNTSKETTKEMQKVIIEISIALSIVVAPTTAQSARCSDYASQEQAQAASENGNYRLDGDNDGVACENLPSEPIHEDFESGDDAIPDEDEVTSAPLPPFVVNIMYVLIGLVTWKILMRPSKK